MNTTGGLELKLTGCSVCDSSVIKTAKPSDGILEQESCDEECDKDSCVEDCECGECICEECCDKDFGEECLKNCCCVACAGDRVHDTRWDSLYADGLGPISGLRGWTVDYEMCSPKELKRMIQNRGLVDPFPMGMTIKYFYVRVLNKADHSPPVFRFLDFPAEIRNLIYVELLDLPTDRCREHRFCFPQILRTCRQVHKEAGEILYSENTINCDLVARCTLTGPNAYIRTDSFIHNTEVEHHHCCFHHFNVIEPLETIFPSFLGRVQSLHINISFFSYDDKSYAVLNDLVRKHMLQLASALMDSTCLRSLRITIEDDQHAEERPGTAHTFHPLRRIRNLAKVVVSGKINAITASQMVADMEGNAPTFNTLKQLQLIMAEAQAYEALHETIDHFVRPDQYARSFRNRSTVHEILAHHLCQIEFMINPEVYGEILASKHSELEVQVRLAKMRVCLDRVQAENAEKQLKRFLDAKKARTSYAAVATQKSIDSKALSRAQTPPPILYNSEDGSEYADDM